MNTCNRFVIFFLEFFKGAVRNASLSPDFFDEKAIHITEIFHSLYITDSGAPCDRIIQLV
jgi:hypothetical protein